MAVGRLQAALAAATSEVTVAAANINFDFTLVKYEAPKEYQVLGSILSAKRKDNAELGSSHKLARQLGALFESICPATPTLLEAYGNRASEIAKASKSSSEPYINTLFSEYTGIDGTSIWAAATSSRSALHVHLLACILARMWTAQEAVAIWVELVTERKKEIARKLEEGEPVNFSLAAAVGQEISRSQLATWDTSARAWLRTADDVFCRKQKQLELILKNIDLSVDEDSKVFPSVIKTWKIAVETMDKLISGIPQAVQNGATLLGLSAWHLYPNISVYSSGIVEVDMNDSLVIRGGILSLGLSATPHAPEKESGVYWSLSLAQLRYYGHPVKVERGLSKEPRITLSQLNLVVFAALVTEWGLDSPDDDKGAKTIMSVVDYVNSVQQGSKSDRRLLKLLRDGASAYLDRAISDQGLSHKLIQLGRRRSQSLIHGDDKTPEVGESSYFLNLLQPVGFMNAFKDLESRIIFLRHVAKQLAQDESPADAFIIRYVQSPSNISPIYAFATALPFEYEGQPDITPHHRWFPQSLRDSLLPKGEIVTLDAEVKFKCWDECVQIAKAQDPDAYTYHYLIGDLDTVALFVRCRQEFGPVLDPLITIDDLQRCLELNLMDPAILLKLLCYADHGKNDRVQPTIRALGFAATVYDNLPDASIDVGVLNRPLSKRRYIQYQGAHERNQLNCTRDLRCTFSLIAYFESGTHDIDPSLLDNVIAVSSANSLFVACPLIQDPYESFTQTIGIRRILGNIGKPGVTFLLPPQEPIVREINPDSWRMDTYRTFDGKIARSFQNTSVHLSFTEYHVPLFDGSRGTHDNQISFLESVVSVRDKGEWVADIDPLPMLKPLKQYSRVCRRLPIQAPCQHQKDSNSNQNITAVDSWDELLDAPGGIFVVRTGNNWVARLALTLVAYQRMQEKYTKFAVTVCPEKVCWICVQQMYRHHAFIY